MVLEGIINPLKISKYPWIMFFVGILYSSAALLVSWVLFKDFASIIMVFFTVTVSIPFIYYAIKLEEGKDLMIKEERVLLKEHGKTLSLFIFLFLGFVVSFSIWNIVLPAELSKDLFSVQTATITNINSPVTGNAFNIISSFQSILFNNMKLMIFCLVFAFFYGFGAIFILTWNASVIAVAVGDFVRTHLANQISLFPFALMKYLIHGIPEMLAYFMAGLAGGIISIAVIKHDLRSHNFKRIVIDSLDLVFGAVAVLVIAALLEVFVSPLIF